MSVRKHHLVVLTFGAALALGSTVALAAPDKPDLQIQAEGAPAQLTMDVVPAANDTHQLNIRLETFVPLIRGTLEVRLPEGAQCLSSSCEQVFADVPAGAEETMTVVVGSLHPGQTVSVVLLIGAPEDPVGGVSVAAQIVDDTPRLAPTTLSAPPNLPPTDLVLPSGETLRVHSPQ